MRNFIKFVLVIFFSFFILSLNADDLKKEFYKKISNIYPSEIFFEQRQDDQENYINGWMIIGGTGLARTEFAPPNHMIIVADGNWLILHDALYNRTSYFPLNYGLFSILLEPKKIYSSEDYILKKTVKSEKLIYTLTTKKQNLNAELKVFFKNDKDINKSYILGWSILEGNGKKTHIEVTKFRRIGEDYNIKQDYFKLTEKMRKDRKVFLGPYSRKIKKIPSHGKVN